MEARLQRRVQRYGWDAAAEIYDAVWRPNLRQVHDTLLEMADLRPGERVLELACGSGFITFRAAESVGETGCVLASDISDEMVRLTGERARQRGFDQVSVARRDAESPGPSAADFDAALCALGLMYLPEPEAALSEMYRALRPGGRAVAAVWGERRNCAWAEIFPIVDTVVQSEVCPLFFSLGAGESLARAFEGAGFASVESRRLSVTLTFADEAELLAAIVDGGAVALAAKRFDTATRKEVDATFLASVADHRNGLGFRVPGEFVVATGRKPE